MSELGKLLRKLRRDRDMTQAQVAQRAGVQVRSLGDWERGCHNPSINALTKLANLYGVTMDMLVKEAAWKPLRLLEPGFVFVTQDGTLAVKSEYHLAGGQCMCILLGSGEYAHFPKGDETIVQAIELKAMES